VTGCDEHQVTDYQPATAGRTPRWQDEPTACPVFDAGRGQSWFGQLV
jgi:hypothetical protein